MNWSRNMHLIGVVLKTAPKLPEMRLFLKEMFCSMKILESKDIILKLEYESLICVLNNENNKSKSCKYNNFKF